MTRPVLCLTLITTLSGCMISREGVHVSQPPPAVQGSNDVQGNPLSTPGAGMGVGSGNPAAPGPSGLGGSATK